MAAAELGRGRSGCRYCTGSDELCSRLDFLYRGSYIVCVCVVRRSLREGEQFVRPSLARDASKREEVWGATSTINEALFCGGSQPQRNNRPRSLTLR